jgi:hypothetical protein
MARTSLAQLCAVNDKPVCAHTRLGSFRIVSLSRAAPSQRRQRSEGAREYIHAAASVSDGGRVRGEVGQESNTTGTPSGVR